LPRAPPSVESRAFTALTLSGEAGEQHVRELGPQLLLELSANRDPLLLDQGAAARSQLAVGIQPIEGPLETRIIGVLGHSLHVS